MKIAVESEFELSDMSSQVALLTNAAVVNVSAIEFDESNRVIKIPMLRKHYVRKKRFLGLGVGLQLQSSDTIQSQLIVRDYLRYVITNPLQLRQITILFGVTVGGKELYLCSVEESEGQMFELSVKLLRYNWELADLTESGTAA